MARYLRARTHAPQRKLAPRFAAAHRRAPRRWRHYRRTSLRATAAPARSRGCCAPPHRGRLAPGITRLRWLSRLRWLRLRYRHHGGQIRPYHG
jgi:hypothetical protein